MQDKTWYSILGLEAEPLFLKDDMLSRLDIQQIFGTKPLSIELIHTIKIKLVAISKQGRFYLTNFL